MYHSNKSHVSQQQKPCITATKSAMKTVEIFYKILWWIRFLSNTFRSDCVNIFADISIFLVCLHQQKLKIHISQPEKVAWRRLVLLWNPQVNYILIEYFQLWLWKCFCRSKHFCICMSQQNLTPHISQQRKVKWER